MTKELFDLYAIGMCYAGVIIIGIAITSVLWDACHDATCWKWLRSKLRQWLSL